ncbi:NYN domain-containing protein [Corynebacterium heidelbergense]|uniref:NYN domain-containing protein n=1 Tax=Corynebacterium heidelbergense TaxID=2055947 RepID=A0A364V9J1_9CORY|nr:NYN domain-containing protein [Corynebacterium heidelbergense]RAV33305.1 NYN domain-containing protein [Corynebacterium heidelbergense]WCZ35678.1 NYN domain protein [Corynebacterium heidelbergense]
MMERTQIYVDTSYLLASFYNSWDDGARPQLDLDLPEVVAILDRMATEQLKQPVHRQFWYDGIPESGPHRYQRALRYEPGVQLRAGQLIELGDRRTQKAVDTRLVADMVAAALRGLVSDIILVSGDADMLPGVEEAVNAGIRVHLYGFSLDSMSKPLRFACDTTTILDPREDFRDTMRLQILEGPIAPSVPGSVDANPPSAFSNNSNTDPGAPATADPSEARSPAPSPATSAAASGTTNGHGEDNEDNRDRDLSEDAAQPSPLQGTVDAVQAAQVAQATSSTPPRQGKQGTPAPSTPGATGTPGTGSSPDARGRASTSTENGEAPNTQAQAPSTAGHNGGQAERTNQRPTPNSLPKVAPNPSMMAPRRKLRSRYVPVPNEVWTSSGTQNPFEIGQQYAVWWFKNGASETQRNEAHLLTGGVLPSEIDHPLLRFACDVLHEYTLSEFQRVELRDGFHTGIREIMLGSLK